MKHTRSLILFSILAIAGQSHASDPASIDRVRFFPAPGREQAMVGGKITGSNVSEREGFEPIAGAEITATPAPGEWSEITFPNTKLYRWIRYEAPASSHGNVAELEFYSGKRQMLGKTFGSFGWRGLHNWPRAFDKKTDTFFDSDIPDGQYVGVDVGEAATAQMPRMEPPPGTKESDAAVQIALRCNTPGAVVRYSFTGAPGPGEGTVYEKPIPLDHRTTIFAVAFKDRMPPSPVACGTYLAGTPLKPGLHSFHVGNSLTASLLPFPKLAVAAGYAHDFHPWLKDGGNTPLIWQNMQAHSRADWAKELASMPRLDDFTVQPRLPGFTDADLANEAKFDALFFDATRAKSPDVQPWIYSEWPSRRPGFNGWPPPSSTYGEACAALMMCSEKIQRDVCEISSAGKKPRILPCTLAVARLIEWLDRGRIPGLSARDFDPVMFYDNVHPGDAGRYLLCMTWFAAFYGESPIGKIPPVNTNISTAQADALQRLAWDVVKNYPDCGLCEEGTQPCARPEFASDGKVITLKSATPGAWFRYTRDGTVPARTRGYVYCGAISVQPGITVKAIAYKSGMADSEVSAQ